jgi:hypothetical protein
MSKRAAAPLSHAASLTVEPLAATKPVTPQQPVTLDDGWSGQGRGSPPSRGGCGPLGPSSATLWGKKALRLYAVERGVKVHDAFGGSRDLGGQQGALGTMACAVRRATASPERMTIRPPCHMTRRRLKCRLGRNRFE